MIFIYPCFKKVDIFISLFDSKSNILQVVLDTIVKDNPTGILSDKLYMVNKIAYVIRYLKIFTIFHPLKSSSLRV